MALELRKKYEVDPEVESKGINYNDSLLIARAKNHNLIVVTYEGVQHKDPNMSLSNYRIPLVCKEEGVDCIAPGMLFRGWGQE